ncbi:hypothetical protein [Nannocystis bainbridge]|uniref:Uncharacterized protein n=1 Tax=Nannocystis bainbridge TaxID=2995303 RepID=A0ABT5DU78_9BACT|nr:hypothetical protein [Nannocystis bainbridge]MDC0717205.1 hypothetical protein [Nannocystis bainbridge]
MMVARWFWSFAFTQLVEVPIYLRALGGPDQAPRLSRPQRLGLGFLASALTHPYVWFVFFGVFYSRAYEDLGYHWPFVTAHRYTIYFIVAETFAVVVEALLLRGCGLRRAFLWALLANATSAGLGFFSRHFLGWPG